MCETVNILVCGRGLCYDEKNLSHASLLRVELACEYVIRVLEADCSILRIVFSGGWGEVSAGMLPPRAQFREGYLMRSEAMKILDGHNVNLSRVTLVSESNSRSTVENLLNTYKENLLKLEGSKSSITIVGHKSHSDRIVYLAKRIWKDKASNINRIDLPDNQDLEYLPMSEKLALLVTKILYFGSFRSLKSLENRNKLVMGLIRGIRKVKKLKLKVASRCYNR